MFYERSSFSLFCVFIRVPPTSSDDLTPTDAVLSPATCNSAADAATSFSSGDALPTQDDVVKKTDRITKRLQELFLAAQEGNRIWYVTDRNW